MTARRTSSRESGFVWAEAAGINVNASRIADTCKREWRTGFSGEAVLILRSIHACGSRCTFSLPPPPGSIMSLRGLLIASLLAAASASGAQPSTVILVRHAERAAAPASDPVLTEAGTQRAIDLATALAGARVT